MASPILIYTPGGGVPGGPPFEPIVPVTGPVYSQAGTTPLIEGQAYIDVVFSSTQTDDEWVLVECIVVNELDGDPLNIWPGIITEKVAAGFRLQLNGMPDSNNYYLHWAVTGVNIIPVPATSYLLFGPASGPVNAPSTFTVHLPANTTLEPSVTVTPSDGGGGGTFTPTSVVLDTGTRLRTFTYTPASYGAKTISTTNSGGLTDPVNISFTPLSSTYTFSGPSAGGVGMASTPFTVALPVGGTVVGTVTVTPHDGGAGGTFTPSTRGLTTVAPSATFTYAAFSTGIKTLSVTNNGGLTNPADLIYTAAITLANNAPVSTWPDSSINGNDATQTGTSRPIFKTAIVGGKPVVRFTSSGTSGLNLASAISSAGPFSLLAVVNKSAGVNTLVTLGTTTESGPAGILIGGAGLFYYQNRAGYRSATSPTDSLFHVFAFVTSAADSFGTYLDGAAPTGLSGTSGTATTANFTSIGYRSFDNAYTDGDIAELIFYNVELSTTDRANIEKYLGTKYGLTVAGGTAVQPDTITGLKGWWKADSLG